MREVKKYIKKSSYIPCLPVRLLGLKVRLRGAMGEGGDDEQILGGIAGGNNDSAV